MLIGSAYTRSEDDFQKVSGTKNNNTTDAPPLKSEIRGRWEREVLAESFHPWVTVSLRVAGSFHCCLSPTPGCSCCSCPLFGSQGSLGNAASPGVPKGQVGTVRLSSPATSLLSFLLLALLETTWIVKFG